MGQLGDNFVFVYMYMYNMYIYVYALDLESCVWAEVWCGKASTAWGRCGVCGEEAAF